MVLFALSPIVAPENIILNSFDVQDGPSVTENDKRLYTIQASIQSKEVHPRVFSGFKKLIIALLYTGLSIGVQLNSSINGSVIVDLANKYRISITEATCTMTIFMCGMATNVTICGPLTELHGRKNIVCYSTFISGLVTLCATFVNNFGGYMAFRFFAGFFGAPALLVAGSVIKDLFNDKQRAYALLLVSVLIGSMPAVGGIAARSALEHNIIKNLNQINLIPGLIITIFGILAILFVRETYIPVINKRLEKKVNRSKSTKRRLVEHFNLELAHNLDHKKNDSPIEGPENGQVTIKAVADENSASENHSIIIRADMNIEKDQSKGYVNMLLRKLLLPYRFLADPLLMTLTIISSYYSGSMYLHVTNFPSIIKEYHNNSRVNNTNNIVSPDIVGIAFTIGLASFGSCLLFLCSYIYSAMITTHKEAIPELKLLPLLLGAILITSSSAVIYCTDVYFSNLNQIFIAQILHGAGFFLTQQSVFLYIMEIYGQKSASACSLMLLFRNLIGGLIPLFGSQIIFMYNNKAFLIFGIINIVFAVIVGLTIAFGYKIRKTLKHCVVQTRYKNYENSSA